MEQWNKTNEMQNSNDVRIIDLDSSLPDKNGATGGSGNTLKIQVDSQSNCNSFTIEDSSTTSTSDIVQTVLKLRQTFNRGVTKNIEWRRKQLRNLQRMFEDNKTAMVEALYKDLRRPKLEAFVLEINLMINEVIHVLGSLDKWVKPEKPSKDFAQLLDDVVIYHEPFGVVLIIGTWNYPFQLSLMPMAGAIAAGNTIVIKPSELANASAKLMAEMVPKYLDQNAFAVIEGGPKETTELLQQRFDYIFFTGGTSIGRIVYEAAIKHLTPVTLELGGKSPVYIDKTADILITAKRVLWAKFVNSGQTCVAPDYIICTKETQDKFLDAAKKVLYERFGNDVQKSSDYCRIINNRHFNRLLSLIDASRLKIAIGGRSDESDNYIEPTVLANVTEDDEIMEDEIFGPILPIVPVSNVEEAIRFINSREKPLVLYIFSKDKKVTKRFINETSSGNMVINDCLMHMSVDSLPFGGVGYSGFGSYHGKTSFDTFTHKKGTLQRDFSAIGEKLASGRYPPYSAGALSFLQQVTWKRNLPSCRWCWHCCVFTAGFVVAAVLAVVWYKVIREE